MVDTAAPVEREVRLGVDRTVRLSGDVVEAADPAARQEPRVAEPGPTQTVWIDRGVDPRSSLAVGLVLVDDHDLPVRADRGVAEVALAERRGHVLGCAEISELP